MYAFVNTEVDRVASLATRMQKLAEENKAKGLKTLVVFVGGPEMKDQIEKLGSQHNITIPMTFLPKGKQDPSLTRYKINPEAETTILVANRNRVLAKFVNLELDPFAKVEAEAEKPLTP